MEERRKQRLGIWSPKVGIHICVCVWVGVCVCMCTYVYVFGCTVYKSLQDRSSSLERKLQQLENEHLQRRADKQPLEGEEGEEGEE